MNKRATSLIIFGLIIVISGIIIFVRIRDPYYDQVRQAYKFLDSANYHDSISAFDDAIAMNQKRPDAYIGKAKAYLSRLDSDAVQDANVILQDGFLVSRSDEITNAYISLADQLVAINKTDWALDLLTLGQNVTRAESINTKITDILEAPVIQLLHEPYALCEKGDFAAVRIAFQSLDPFEIARTATATNPVFYSPYSEKTAKNGKGLGIYSVGGEIYLYYGDYAENVRSGHGVWLLIGKHSLYSWLNDYIFEGEWANDAPNGSGETTYVTTRDNTTQRTEILGTYQNGLENGEITYTTASSETRYTAENGISTESLPEAETEELLGVRGFTSTGHEEEGDLHAH